MQWTCDRACGKTAMTIRFRNPFSADLHFLCCAIIVMTFLALRERRGCGQSFAHQRPFRRTGEQLVNGTRQKMAFNCWLGCIHAPASSTRDNDTLQPHACFPRRVCICAQNLEFVIPRGFPTQRDLPNPWCCMPPPCLLI